MEEQDRLRKEIEYYTALINSHGPGRSHSSVSRHSRNYPNIKPNISASSSKYSLVRNNQQKHEQNPGNASESKTKLVNGRTVLPPKEKGRDIPSRTVVISGDGRRTVLKPSHSPKSVKTTATDSTPSTSVVSVLQTQRPVEARPCDKNIPQKRTAVFRNPGGKRSAAVAVGRSAELKKVENISRKEEVRQSGKVNRSSDVKPGGKVSQSAEVNQKVAIKQSEEVKQSAEVKQSVVDSHSAGVKAMASRSRFIWVNSKILPTDANAKYAFKKSDTSSNDAGTSASFQKSNVGYIKSQYVIRKSTFSNTPQSQALQAAPGSSRGQHRLTALGKYKLVSRKSGGNMKSPKFMLKSRPPVPAHIFNRKTKLSPYLSKSGKRIISRYKIRRRSAEGKASFGASPRLKKALARSPYKTDHRNNPVIRSRYKIDRVRGMRKPVRITPKSRKHDRKRYQWVKHELKGTYRSNFFSPFRLSRRSIFNSSSDEIRQKKNGTDNNWIVRKIASRSLQKSAAVSARAKYKKNNTSSKHCLFYMRFGKCKRGEQCYYIHDPDRIAVCTRYLRGTCNIENCLFSHEAKKEKVPVCQHFLRGCCLRDSCPYLHVNVGKNAPVCKSFAEYRYCHLGEQCKKLHTDICPNRDDEGKCPKGGKCRLRHPKRIVKRNTVIDRKESALPETSNSTTNTGVEESPVEDDGVRVLKGEKLTHALPAFISLTKSDKVTIATKGVKKLKNKPDFL